MQRKVGIRLRHLQSQPEHQRQTPNTSNIQHIPIQQHRKRQRSQSPLNRRRIFNQQNISQYPQTYQNPAQQKQRTQPSKSVYQIMSPILNQPLNNNIQINEGNEYESQIQRLIDSLKKKSIELQKKQQIINKLKKQVQYLKAENSQYLQQIKSLKAQIQYQKVLKAKTINSNNLINNDINQIPISTNINKTNKNIYKNQKYQQLGYKNQTSPIIHVKLNPKKLEQKQQLSYINSNNNKSRINMNMNINIDQAPKQQDTTVQQYLSPLMVLNSGIIKTNSPFSAQYPEKVDISKNQKTNSRISYDMPIVNNNYSWQKQQNKNKYQNTSNFNIYNNLNRNSSANQNSFTKKQSSYPSNPFQNNHNAHTPVYQHTQQNSAYFAPQQQIKSNPFKIGSNIKQNPFYDKNNKQLAIDDSKQFHFEDFDFSQLDNQIGQFGNSKF